MSKTYISQKDLPDCDAGTKFVHDGKSSYDYIGKNNVPGYYDEDTIENNPEWFLPEESPLTPHGIDIQNAIAMLHADGYKIISPEEKNKKEPALWMMWDGHKYLLSEDATIVGKPAFLMSEKGKCIKRWVPALNTTDHWMCEPIGILASSNKELGLPSIEEYSKMAVENKSNDSFQWTDELVQHYEYGAVTKKWADIYEFKKLYHKCKYCGAMTTQPDEDCFKAPQPQKEEQDKFDGKKGNRFLLDEELKWPAASEEYTKAWLKIQHEVIKTGKSVEEIIKEINPEYANLDPATKLYTQQQVDAMCEDAARKGFYGGRERQHLPIFEGDQYKSLKYLSFEDYYQDKSKNSKQ